jgi:4-amino-4-deoxy-L-arabinose transferase-like glycosyltransferase
MHIMPPKTDNFSGFVYSQKRLLIPGILGVMLLIAFTLRISISDDSRHVAEVQYRSALIARSIYFNLTDSIPEWRRQANSNSLHNLPDKEPPITEILTAIAYKFAGREDLRIPRLLTSIYWLVGGLFLYKIAKEWGSTEGAITAIAYYLFVPLGVKVSISFQPDSLMIMMFLISLYAILQYYEEPTWHKLIIAAILSGFAILVKPFVLFAISGTFLGLSSNRNKGFRHLLDKRLILFFVASYIPIIFYYGYEIYITGQLTKQAEVSFLPQLLFTKDYWKDWMQTAVNVIGLTPLLAAFIGIPMTPKRALRAMLIGLWGGYIIFCLVFTYHIRYAGYYHMQLIPIVALSFAPIVPVFTRHINRLNNRWYWSLFYIAAIFLLFLLNFREINNSIRSTADIERKEVAEEIGGIVHHSARTVYIASYYGRPLEYYAELTGTYWPRSISDIDSVLGRNQASSVEERLEKLWFIPEYFVITAMREYHTYHNDLKEYLENNCRLVRESDEFIIYGSCVIEAR